MRTLMHTHTRTHTQTHTHTHTHARTHTHSLTHIHGAHRFERVEAVVHEERRVRPEVLLPQPLQHLSFDRSRGRRSQTVGADCLTVCHPRDRTNLTVRRAARIGTRCIWLIGIRPTLVSSPALWDSWSRFHSVDLRVEGGRRLLPQPPQHLQEKNIYLTYDVMRRPETARKMKDLRDLQDLTIYQQGSRDGSGDGSVDRRFSFRSHSNTCTPRELFQEKKGSVDGS